MFIDNKVGTFENVSDVLVVKKLSTRYDMKHLLYLHVYMCVYIYYITYTYILSVHT